MSQFVGDQAGRPCAVKRNATDRAGVQSSVTPPAKQESPCAFKRNEIEQTPVVELTCVCCCCLASVSLSNVYIYTHARTHAHTHAHTHTHIIGGDVPSMY